MQGVCSRCACAGTPSLKLSDGPESHCKPVRTEQGSAPQCWAAQTRSRRSWRCLKGRLFKFSLPPALQSELVVPALWLSSLPDQPCPWQPGVALHAAHTCAAGAAPPPQSPAVPPARPCAAAAAAAGASHHPQPSSWLMPHCRLPTLRLVCRRLCDLVDSALSPAFALHIASHLGGRLGARPIYASQLDFQTAAARLLARRAGVF